nr:hypothetical protein [Serratia symbiotica]
MEQGGIEAHKTPGEPVFLTISA